MLKKRLYIVLNILLYCFAVTGMRAQNITVPETNITSQTDYSINEANGEFAVGLGLLLPTISVRSNTIDFPATTAGTLSSLPLRVVNIKLSTIGGVNLLAGASNIILSTSNQAIFNAVASIGGGPIVNTYNIKIAGNAWLAGIYSTTLTFSSSLLTTVKPTTPTLTINVPGFIMMNAVVPATNILHVNSLDYFRAVAGVSTSATFNYFTTVPTIPNLKATNTNTFTFSTTQLHNQLPAANNVNLLNVKITDPLGTAINLSDGNQPLTASSGLPVVLTNRKSVTSTFSIAGANLKSNFVQAGTYKVPLTYTIAKTASAYPNGLTSRTMESSIEVIVDNLSQLQILDPSVSFNFNSAAAYQNGLTTKMPAHVKVSATVPYSVTVKASSNFFNSTTSGQIPVSVITIEGMPSQSGIIPVILSNNPQPIVTSADPIIDRLLNLQYRIPATKTSSLVGKPSGEYTTTITYSLVAP